jgi:glycerol-3-phosphate dehydrogenase (NAD(P)+)
MKPDGRRVAQARIGVVGAGSWGTALANLLAAKGYEVDLWVFEAELQEQMASQRENRLFLPGVRLSERLRATCDLERVVARKDLVALVVPSHVMRAVASRIKGCLAPETILVTASKGIENDSYLTMTGVLMQVLPAMPPSQLAVLSGPSFAREVARDIPTVVTVAAREPSIGAFVQQVFATPVFRVYTNDDVIGVELGGAVKNVIAIAAGIIDGMGLGLNTRAALITRGLTEIRRLGVRLGANPRTFTGLAGMGDLLLTCTGELSRNHTVGKLLGQGRQLPEILGEMRMVAEGVKTAQSVHGLAQRLGVEMPITAEIYRILYEHASPQAALRRLMTRDLKDELDER